MIVCHAVKSCCDISSAYIDNGDMLNNFCFHVYAQKSLFMIVCHADMLMLMASRSDRLRCHADDSEDTAGEEPIFSPWSKDPLGLNTR